MPRTEIRGGQILDASVALGADVSGTLLVANGGTGSSTLANGAVLLGAGTGALGNVAPGTNGNVLTSNGTAWTSAAATAPSTEITSPLHATGSTSYADNSSYWGQATTANGWSTNGFLSGFRKGTVGVQRLQSDSTGQTQVRYWINGSTAWSSWVVYLDAADFTAKGSLLTSTASNAFAELTAGANNSVLVADNGQASGLKWLACWAIPKRVVTLTVAGSTYTPNAGSTDRALITNPATAFTIATPSGTAVDGQQLVFRIKHTAALAITWTTGAAGAYLASGVAGLPTTTVANKTITAAFEYDTTQARFVCLATDIIGY